MDRNIFFIFFVIGGILFLQGCQTLSRSGHSRVPERIPPLTGAMIGKQLSEEELRTLTQQIKTDKEARSAVNAIAGSMGGSPVAVKYCPVDGQRYAPHLTTCPVHNVSLKNVGE